MHTQHKHYIHQINRMSVYVCVCVYVVFCCIDVNDNGDGDDNDDVGRVRVDVY